MELPLYDVRRFAARLVRIVQKADVNALAAILLPLNSRDVPSSKSWAFADFMERVYLPFYRRKWKRSTERLYQDFAPVPPRPDYLGS